MKKIKKAGIYRQILSAALVIACLFGALALPSCSLISLKEKFSAEYFEYFDTFSTLTVYADSEEEFAKYKKITEETLSHYHKLFDIENEYEGMNNLATINRLAGKSSVTIDDDLWSALDFAVDMYDTTDGHNNIALGALIALWQEKFEEFSENGTTTLPDAEKVAEALENSDIDTLRLNRRKKTAYISDNDTSLNFGSICKGIAAEALYNALIEGGCRSFLIDLGGNIASHGTKPDGSPWLCEIYNSLTGGSLTEKPIMLKDVSVVTSGSYQRYITVDGTNHSHILDPEDGSSANTFVSVSVVTVSSQSSIADALSTALFCMSYEEGAKLISELEDIEAIWQFPDGRVETSENFDNFLYKK